MGGGGVGKELYEDVVVLWMCLTHALFVGQVCGDVLKRVWPPSEPKQQRSEAVEYIIK